MPREVSAKCMLKFAGNVAGRLLMLVSEESAHLTPPTNTTLPFPFE